MALHERDLVEELLEHYHTGLRPVVKNSSQPTPVKISLRLVQIFEMVGESMKIYVGTFSVQAFSYDSIHHMHVIEQYECRYHV